MYPTPKRGINLTTVHGRRLAEKIALQQSGRTPRTPSYVWRVECSAIPPHIRPRAVKGLTGSKTHIWLRWRDAWELCLWARAARLPAERIKVEYRRCKMCNRIMLGLEATVHRTAMEQSYTPDEVPCSLECQRKYGR